MLLNVQNLSVSYGAIRALHDVSLHINPGEIVTLIGSNGAGKTTLLRTLSGLLRPASGSVTFSSPSSNPALGTQNPALLNSLPPHRIVRLGLSHVPEGRQIFPHHTVRENLLLGAYQQRDRQRVESDLARNYDLFPVLRERSSQRAGTLSGGEQQMLAIARALMAHPTLLLLDEPSLGLAPLIVRKIFQIIRDINAAGTTVFLVEQNAHMALTIAHRGYVLQSGHVLMSDSANNLLQHPDVKKAYLGG
jgi:branched-chain amino acid transport system ATP-binding protein